MLSITPAPSPIPPQPEGEAAEEGGSSDQLAAQDNEELLRDIAARCMLSPEAIQIVSTVGSPEHGKVAELDVRTAHQGAVSSLLAGYSGTSALRVSKVLCRCQKAPVSFLR